MEFKVTAVKQEGDSTISYSWSHKVDSLRTSFMDEEGYWERFVERLKELEKFKDFKIIQSWKNV